MQRFARLARLPEVAAGRRMRTSLFNPRWLLLAMLSSAATWAGIHHKPLKTVRGDGVEVRRGAAWVGDRVMPEFAVAALGEAAPVAPWRPGDPIREVPRQFYGDVARVPVRPANPTVPIDALAVLQRDQDDARQPSAFATPLFNVAGQAYSGVMPPDPAGDVGTTHYVQAINGNSGALYRIYDKSGAAVTGTLSLEALGMGGACASGAGDPIVLFDELANRWLLTEFSSNAGRSVCIYLSQYADPTVSQTWTRYVVQMPSFPDYPKYGVWPDAYYLGTNEAPTGAEIYALDRAGMLAGLPIATQRFVAPALPGFGFQVLQPVDLDGAALPPAGAPGVFLRHRDDEAHDPGANHPSADRLELFELAVDWSAPANSTLTGPIPVAVSEFSSDINGLSSFNGFAQPSGQKLDPLREQVMFRPAYRAFGTFEQIVGNFTTDIDGADTGGVRWFELRRSGGPAHAWRLYQEGTLALGDHVDRWMGAVASDQDGNLGLAYSAVRDTTHSPPNHAGVPAGLRFSGRLDGDTVDVMTLGESLLVAGTGSQSGNRWGDYQAMSVDPADGCTFWFTGAHVAAGQWATRIAGLRHDRCGTPQFMLNAADLRFGICTSTLPRQLALDVDVLARNGFAGPVALQFGALPPGVSGLLAPTSVAAPGTSSATLDLTAGVPTGRHVVPIVGTAGALTKTFAVRLDIVAGAVELLAPADAATGVDAVPTFVWAGDGDTTQYRLEVANDAAFLDIVYAATVSGTRHVPANPLAYDRQYYWRVRRLDGSCAAALSASRMFVTRADPAQCPGGSAAVIVFSDPVEPALPGWVVSELPSQGAPGWSESGLRPHSPTRAWFGSDSAVSTEQRLDSPSIDIPVGSTSTILRFSHAYDLEDSSATECWDGATLDVSANAGGSYAPVPGASIVVGNDMRTITAAATGHPLGPGRSVWCGSAPTHRPVVALLGNLSGQTLRLRFRVGTDTMIATEGWHVDDVQVLACMPATEASTTTLTSTSNPSVHGQEVVLTATVGGGATVPTGSVEFRRDTTLLGVSPLSAGVASWPLGPLATGSHAYSATYAGDATYLGSGDGLTQVVDRAATQLALSAAPNPSVQGDPVVVSASLSVLSPGAGTPTGPISVVASGGSQCSISLPAQASCMLSFDDEGAQTVDASYGGDAHFESSVAPTIDHVATPSGLMFRDGFEQ